MVLPIIIILLLLNAPVFWKYVLWRFESKEVVLRALKTHLKTRFYLDLLVVPNDEDYNNERRMARIFGLWLLAILVQTVMVLAVFENYLE